MNAIVNNIKSMWNAHDITSVCCVNAAKRMLNEFEKGWMEVEEYWIEHPEARIEFFYI